MVTGDQVITKMFTLRLKFFRQYKYVKKKTFNYLVISRYHKLNCQLDVYFSIRENCNGPADQIAINKTSSSVNATDTTPAVTSPLLCGLVTESPTHL